MVQRNFQISTYQKQMKPTASLTRDQMINNHYNLVKKVAYRILYRLPNGVDVNDLISAGILGLIDAVDKFDPSKEKRFESYAEFRVKGAILDELRSYDYMTRTTRRKSNKINKAASELEHELGRPPTAEELAGKLEISIEDYHLTIKEAQDCTFLDVDDLGIEGKSQLENILDIIGEKKQPDQYSKVYLDDLIAKVQESIEELPEKLKLVVGLYYFDELNYKEIGNVLDVSESRVSQIHSDAIKKIKKKLNNY